MPPAKRAEKARINQRLRSIAVVTDAILLWWFMPSSPHLHADNKQPPHD